MFYVEYLCVLGSVDGAKAPSEFQSLYLGDDSLSKPSTFRRVPPLAHHAFLTYVQK